MYQERSMSVTDVTDSPKFWDKTDNKTYLCKNVVNNNTIRKHYIGTTLIQKI